MISIVLSQWLKNLVFNLFNKYVEKMTVILEAFQSLNCFHKFHEAFKSILRFSAHIEGKRDIITNTYTA